MPHCVVFEYNYQGSKCQMRTVKSYGVMLLCLLSLGNATSYADPGEPAGSIPVAASGGHARAYALGQFYHSPKLQADFITQYMYLTTPAGTVYFWGARIVGIDTGSPLEALSLHAGDVITRLDGIKITQGMSHVVDDYWVLPELEKHYSSTEVRYIITGTNEVKIGKITLPPYGGGGGPTPIQP
jgi:hypothetical protein